jgi:rhodanese-related sulfurtransferase
MKPLRECLLIIVLATVPALLNLWLNPKRPVMALSQPGVTEVELSQTATWPQPVLWIDARPAEAFHRQHIPGAILLNETGWEQQLPDFLAAWKPGTRIIVYCDAQTCDASQSLAQRIDRELHLPDIYVLKGGWASWLQAHR